MIWNRQSAPNLSIALVAQFVDAQQLGFDVGGQRPLEAARGLGGGQCVDDVDGAGKQHRVPALACRVAQCGHQMALAQAGAGDKNDVGALGDEVQVEEVLDLWAVDLGGPVPVELVDGLEHREAGLIDAALDASILAGGGLAVEQLGEVVEVRPVLVGSRLGQRLAVLAHERQVQRGELGLHRQGVGVRAGMGMALAHG